MAQARIAYKALDNGILSCADPIQLQVLADGLSTEKIEALARKWQACLPKPFTSSERAAGYDYEISILQVEFALTQVLDRPLSGRLFFEEAIRENLDLGRPEQVQLIFERRITRATPSRFRTRIITEGVTPALHVDYKHSRIKQYHKEGRALRTETTINDTRDFHIGKRLKNLPASAFKPTDVFCTSNLSAMIASWVRMPFSKSTNLKLFSVSEWRLYVSQILAYMHY